MVPAGASDRGRLSLIDRPIRTAVVFPLPVPYRNPLFELISADPTIDLTVFFCLRTQVGRDWEPAELRYSHRFLKSYGRAVQGRDLFTFHINPGIVPELRQGRFDVIVVSGLYHATMQLAILFAIATRTPYLVWNESHHVRSRRPPLYTRALKSAIYRPFIKRAAGCLVTGSYARDYFVSYGGRPDRTFLVANTADVKALAGAVEARRSDAEKLKIELGVAGQQVLLYVGRLVGVKGVEHLLRAFKAVCDHRTNVALVVVGDGPLGPELKARCDQLGLRHVVFVGFKQPAELPTWYSMADLFVLPSVSEPWGTVVNEAMAAGLPVVVTRTVGAAGDLVLDGENGYVVPEADPSALTVAILDILADDERRRRMGERSAEIIASWTHEASAEAFSQAIRVAVGKGPSG